MSSENIPELDLYTALMDRVMALDQIKHFDYYTDQLEREQNMRGDTHRWPAVFLRWKPINWERLGLGRKHAELTGYLVVALKNVLEVSAQVQESTRAKAFSVFQISQAVEEVIDGYRPPVTGCGTITYEQTDPVDSLKGVSSHIISFKCRITNDTVIRKYQNADPKPGLSISDWDLIP